MNLQKFSLLASLVLLLFANSFSQITLTAYKIPDGAITIDGKLDEACWANATKITIDSSKAFYGQSTNRDCHAEFKVMWGNAGMYVGVWFHDDIHNAMNSTYLDAANIAYDDDAVQLFFNSDFYDAWADTTNPFYGTDGIQLVKGFGNLDPPYQYAGMWGDGPPGWRTAVYDVSQQNSMGWRNIFTTVDGINFQYESLVSWDGLVFKLPTIPVDSQLIAFNLRLTDNDGDFTHERILSLTAPFTHVYGGSVQHWAKVILVGDSFPAIPILKFSKDTVRLTMTEGTVSYPSDTVVVTNDGFNTLNDIIPSKTYVNGTNWLDVTKAGAGNTQKICIAVKSGTYPANSYVANISVASAGASNSPETCTVILYVQPALPVAIKRGSTKTPYATLAEATGALQNNDTLLIQKDVTGDITLSNKNFTILGTGVSGKAKIYGTVSLTSCTTTVTNIAINGKNGVDGGRNAVWNTGSCPSTPPVSGGNGGKALDLASSKVTITNSYLKGGNGGMAGKNELLGGLQPVNCGCGNRGNGGNALGQFSSFVVLTGSELAGGLGGATAAGGCLPLPGGGTIGVGGALVNHSRIDTSTAIIDTLVWDATSTIGPGATPGIAAGAPMGGTKGLIQQIGFVNGEVQIRYMASTKGPVKIELFDAAGRCQMTLASEAIPGEHTLSAGGAALRPGVYLVKATIGGQSQSRRVALMK